jgi:hypothetical protein
MLPVELKEAAAIAAAPKFRINLRRVVVIFLFEETSVRFLDQAENITLIC